ncbi:hypothetical protein H1230_18775 [Paenibacillus sp. 19GGS1-52]|uniref:hypothetical protein n=1 Tax=Paenibacillus sp. 19GGS1-52 TaxID=2758563 RepID=UPI001EFA5754|nr:hypothetical protein [Paenibacillus sp. 19GGS1-52]ULO05155.1 hypothetical protein H1230_18775 [Paenibacillus sp. 19GGS1-52]
MFEKKKVSQLVNEFLEKVSSREAKVEENVNKLKAQAEAINKSVAEQTAAMIECELQDDATGAEKLRKSVRLLSTELIEVQSSIEAYSNQSGVSADYSKQIQVIRSTAVREVQENQKRVQAIQKEKAAIDLEIKALEGKKEQLDDESSQLNRSGPEVSLIKMLPYIDPRTKKLASFEHHSFFQQWINGEDTEHLLAEKPEYRGVKLTQGDIQQSTPKPTVHIKRTNSLDHRASFEQWKAANPKASIVEVSGLDSAHGPLEIHYTLNE